MFSKVATFLCFISFCATEGSEDVYVQPNCTPAAIYDFPSDGFTREQRRSGWIAVHVVLAIYCFLALSTVCSDFFVPAIHQLVESLNVPEDVAGASFMAITSSTPELFMNIVGTFITEGDIGVDTVVGSNVFNILAVSSLCGLFSKTAFRFETWTIVRDGLMYAISIVVLVVILYDDRVYWYEAMVLILMYVVYLSVMYFSKSIVRLWRGREKTDNAERASEYELKPNVGHASLETESDGTKKHVEYWKIFVCPMRYTIPSAKKLYLLTLFMCMVWIGIISYIVAWLITAIGDAVKIPDSVMALTFLAIGSSIPEIVTCIRVSRNGHGVMGMSSALGANTFEILLCLGLPWLIKTCTLSQATGRNWIKLNSDGLTYDAICLLSTLVLLFICLVCNRFRLDKKIGVVCLLIYLIFLTIVSLLELNVFFSLNLPTCE